MKLKRQKTILLIRLNKLKLKYQIIIQGQIKVLNTFKNIKSKLSRNVTDEDLLKFNKKNNKINKYYIFFAKNSSNKQP